MLDVLRILMLVGANAALVWIALSLMRRASGDPVYPIPDARAQTARRREVSR